MADYHTDNAVFLVYKDWESLFDSLDSNEEAGELIKALFAFAKRGEIAEFSGALKMAFIFMSQQLERDGLKWEETCNRRSESGKKGGRPAKAKESKKTNCFLEKQNKAKEADTDTDTEKDTDTVTDKDTVKSQKHKFGEFNHVRLTEDEYSRLCEDYGKDTADYYIKKVDEYCEMKGKTYKNFNLAIRNTFMARDNIRKVERPSDKPDEELSVQEQIFRKLRC